MRVVMLGHRCRGASRRVLQALHAQDGRAFCLGQPTPNSVWLTGSQRPCAADPDHGAVLADLFGLDDPGSSVAPVFAGGVVEELDVVAAAGSEQLPVPVIGDWLGGLMVDDGRPVVFRASVVMRPGRQCLERVS